MRTMNTSELSGAALDWAVAKCEDLQHVTVCNGDVFNLHNPYRPSSDWSQGGPIIERECIDLQADEFYTGNRRWMACVTNECVEYNVEGPTALIAAMRCLAASKLGLIVEIPEELAQ